MVVSSPTRPCDCRLHRDDVSFVRCCGRLELSLVVLPGWRSARPRRRHPWRFLVRSRHVFCVRLADSPFNCSRSCGKRLIVTTPLDLMAVATLLLSHVNHAADMTDRRSPTVPRHLATSPDPPALTSASDLCRCLLAIHCAPTGGVRRSSQAARRPPAAAQGSRRHVRLVPAISVLPR